MAQDESPDGGGAGPRKPTLLDRVQADRERGDLWLARQRLRSCLLTRGYDPAVLSMLGDIAEAMHDAYDAGRMWLTSDAHGDRVDRAVQTFMKYAGRTPSQILSQIPPVLCRQPFEKLHPVAQERLRRLALDAAWVAARRQATRPAQRTTLAMKLVTAIAFAIFIWGIVAFFVGSVEIVRWLF